MESTHKLYKPACLLTEAIEYVLQLHSLPRTTTIEMLERYTNKGKTPLYLRFYHKGKAIEHLKIQQNPLDEGELYKPMTLETVTTPNTNQDSIPVFFTVAVGRPLIKWLRDTMTMDEQFTLPVLTDHLPSARQITIDDILADLP